MLVMVDGIDGSGKQTIVQAMACELQRRGQSVFNIGEWSKARGCLPEPSEFAAAHVIIGVEPSYAWTGAAIRQEMIRADRAYHPRDIAAAFAQDRLVLYRRCYLPALAAGKTIIAERGLSSSLVYQPAMDPTISIEELLSLTGNALAMDHAPNHLIIAILEPKTALARLAQRNEKKDESIFEREPFLRQLDERYRSAWFRELFMNRGTIIHEINTAGSFEEVEKTTLSVLSQIFDL